MKKKIIYIICVVALVLLLVIAGITINNKNNKTKPIEKSNGEIIKVDSASFKSEVLESKDPVLIDFYADWCPPCKKLSPTIDEIAKENKDIKVVKINIDVSEDIANQYDIYSIPTLVFINKGEEQDRIIGLVPKDTIEAMIEKNK